MRTRLPTTCLLALAAAIALAAPAMGAGPRLLETEQLSPRLTELTFRTSALAAPTKVRVLLPARYKREREHSYPVLYLLHGASGDRTSWTSTGQGDAEALTAKLPLIVVMPDGGRGGFYTNWFNNGAGGQPRWEDWHIKQLIPWVDSHYRTLAVRRERAIAGLSMGGFGTFSYASRHPDLFTAALSLSGAVDPLTPPGLGPPVIDAISNSDGGPPGSLWGPLDTQEVRWRAHNPYDLAENLRGLELWMRTGNGQPGGPFGGGNNIDATEAGVFIMATEVHKRLQALHIPHVFDDYGPGHHLWAYWNRGLKQTLPAIMRRFRQGSKPPARITFKAVEPSYSAYGWSVSIKRPALEFSELSKADKRGFTLSGSGSASVTTPARYKRGASYRVTIRGKARVLRANARGRLRIAVPLGPGNRAQQYTAGATTRVFEARVKIAGAR
jgi:S-formylglutathione hydrolase FrmB